MGHANFGLADRSGCDGLVHLLRALLQEDSERTLLSIDGIGAYDHVLRARMLEELWREPELHDLVPYVRLWLNRQSTFVWVDDEGQAHDVPQGEGGEQGAALMPALFCLAMRPALQEIQARLQPGDLVVAYLDDVYILTTPDRAREAHDVAKEVLKRVCRISVNQGELQARCHAARAAPPRTARLRAPGRRWR